MKNAFKLGFLALALSLSVAACNSEKKAEGADSTAVDSSMTDTSMKDTSMKDSLAKDTLAKDTTKKM
jgi:predicted small lipoprotein YifL